MRSPQRNRYEVSKPWDIPGLLLCTKMGWGHRKLISGIVETTIVKA
uniref:Uncharacterized protein n=1 Tax=Siphoviridae sp. ctxfQ4 TaxID=2826521 RepID=A0A8S5N6J1_9CAUD|nr:MAG TPA: hypothetical protein [Siphoviridae sp. ctxfQ4]